MKIYLRNVLSYLFLSFIFSSCSPAVTEVKVEKQYPSATLLRDCGQPEFKREASVFSDLFPYIKTLQSALAQCNNDKRALRQWQESTD